MASTNKTPHLGLNQWVMDDPFLMEDMNADNQKLDTAVGAQPWVKLMDVTTTVAAKTVELNLSNIDLSQFSHLKIFRKGAKTFYLRLNKSTSYVFYMPSANAAGSGIPLEYGFADLTFGARNCITYNVRYPYQSTADIPFTALQTLDLLENSEGTLDIPAETRFSLWGVKVW